MKANVDGNGINRLSVNPNVGFSTSPYASDELDQFYETLNHTVDCSMADAEHIYTGMDEG